MGERKRGERSRSCPAKLAHQRSQGSTLVRFGLGAILCSDQKKAGFSLSKGESKKAPERFRGVDHFICCLSRYVVEQMNCSGEFMGHECERRMLIWTKHR